LVDGNRAAYQSLKQLVFKLLKHLVLSNYTKKTLIVQFSCLSFCLLFCWDISVICP